jgi:2-polyprenyl-6-methoxyphenol hydroxylase-like FAD-dependent oxidoreductase
MKAITTMQRTAAPDQREKASVLVAGASFAGLATAYWMNRLGYHVTVVEVGKGLKRGGTPVDIREGTVEIIKRMGLFERTWARKLQTRSMSFKNGHGVTIVETPAQPAEEQSASGDYEIDRDVLLDIMFDAVKDDVEFLFGDSIAALDETADAVAVTFNGGSHRSYSLLFGCDGNHSSVRRLHFGPESEYAFFLQNYFAVEVVPGLLIESNTSLIYNVPGRAVMINSYKDKTDVVVTFFSEDEIPYNYRDQAEQRQILTSHFAKENAVLRDWLAKMGNSNDFYFDKFCQIRMPSWTRGRVALVGDAGYCASPAAGMGGSLAIVGAAALADAFTKHPGDVAIAFREYSESLRPFVEQVQADAIDFGLDMFAPRTEEAIQNRNANLTGNSPS